MITLGIIGVVAAITIPNLITNYQKKVTALSLKTHYTKLLQVLKYAEDDYGDMTTWGTNNFGPTTVPYSEVIGEFIHKYITPHYKVMYDCGLSCPQRRSVKVCYLNRTTCNDHPNFYRFQYTLYLNDGSALEFMINNNGTIWRQLRIFIDINGDGAPNIVGKDIFVFLAGENSKKLYGAEKSDSVILGTGGSACNVNAPSLPGAMCGGLIQKNDWKIPDNYPW